MGWGLFVMMAGMTASLIVSWEIQKIDQLLGYTIGVTAMIIVTMLSVYYMAGKMK